MLLKDIIKILDIEDSKGVLDIDITGIAYDSRAVESGNLFVCVKGFNTDGHNYIPQAIAKGAVAIVVETDIQIGDIAIVRVRDTRKALAMASNAFYDFPSSKFKLIGVTGTNGKTTTTYLIKTILELQGAKVGLIGTNQNMIGQKILNATRTTPESMELQLLFSEMVSQGVQYVVMEVSSHALELDRVYGCEFDVGVFTNLTQDHLDFHKTMENYLNAKAKLFSMCKYGVVNVDDRASTSIIDKASCEVYTYSIDNESQIRAIDIKNSEKGVAFKINTPNGEEYIQLGIPGRFSVYNALGSIGACLALGIDLSIIGKGMNLAQGVPGRAQIVETGRDFTVLIDYAHTPDGLENILKTVRGFSKGRIVTLFGCGGDRDRSKRPIMGRIAGELSDFCIITSDNPRSEDPMYIIYEVEKGIKITDCEYITIENRAKAIEYSITNALPNDIIVLAGKGHETYQILKDKTIHFDEKEIVEKLLSI